MKLVEPEFFIDLVNMEDNPYLVVLESPTLFYKFVRELSDEIMGLDTNFVLSHEYNLLDISKRMLLISDPLSMKVNDRKVLAKIQDLVAKQALEAMNYEETNRIISELVNYADLLSSGFNGNIISKNIVSVPGLIKLLEFEVDCYYETYLQLIVDFIKTRRDYLQVDVFCFVNLFSYLEISEIELLIHEINNMHVSVIFLESNDFLGSFKECKKIIIDRDFCQI